MLKSHDKWFGVTYKEDKELVVNEVKALVENGLSGDTKGDCKKFKYLEILCFTN